MIKKNLYIIGARGFGREVYHLANEIISQTDADYVVAGFLDDKKDALDGFHGYSPIVSNVEDFLPSENDLFICALGDPMFKDKYASMILKKGGKFINLIHPWAQISPNTTLGTGCIVARNVSISCDITIGDFNTFQPFVTVGHDCQIGNYNQFNSGVALGGFVKIGDFVSIHPGAVIHPHKKVESQSVVGANSVVIRTVKEGTTVYGNPATRL